MSATRGMLIPNFRQLIFAKMRRQFDKGGPESAVNVGNVALYQLTNEHVRTFTNRVRDAKDFTTFRVTPPTAANGFTDDRFGKTGYRSARSLQHHTTAFYKGKSLFWRHAVLFRLFCRIVSRDKTLRRPSTP